MSAEIPATSRRQLWWVLAGLGLIHLAFWVGPYGYSDLHEYLQDADSLWLRGTLAIPGSPAQHPEYSRFSVGLPLISGPFVYLGMLLELVTSGAIGHRWVVSAMIPLAMLGLYLLIDSIGRRCDVSPSGRLGAVAAVGLSAPALYYGRMFYVEPVVAFFAVLALWAFLCSRDPGATRRFWLAASGGAAAAPVACHYAYAPMLAGLGLALAVAVTREQTGGRRLTDLAALAAAPVLTGSALLALNWSRYQHPFRTGYDLIPNPPPFFALGYVGANGPTLLHIALVVPWLALIIVASVRAARGRADTAICAAAVLAAVAAQECCWAIYLYLSQFPLRYHTPVALTAAAGLPLALQWLRDRGGRRVAGYALGAFLLVGVLAFLGNPDQCRPFYDDRLRRDDPHNLTIATWYRDRGEQTVPGTNLHWPDADDEFSYPLATVRWPQVIVAGMLLSVGALILVGGSRPPTTAFGPPPRPKGSDGVRS